MIQREYCTIREGAVKATYEELKEVSISGNSDDIFLKQAGLVLATDGNGEVLMSDTEDQAIIFGCPGSGKTRRIVMPTIRMLAKSGTSMIISDPKGELYKNTSQALRNKEYKIFVINLRNPYVGNRWNPLARIEKLMRSEKPDERSKGEMELADVATQLSSTVASSIESFWHKKAEEMFLMGVRFLVEFGDENSVTFDSVSMIVSAIHDYCRKTHTADGFDYIIEWLEEHDKKLYRLITDFRASHKAEATAGSMIAEFSAMMKNFIMQESVVDMMHSSDFELNCFGKEKCALYLVVPDDSTTMYDIASVLVKQIYSSLIDIADEQSDGKLPNPVVFMLDEFANFAPIHSFPSMLTAARSRNIRFFLVCQNTDQLNKNYGDVGARIIRSNCRVWMFLSSYDTVFLQEIERRVGYKYLPEGYTVPLIPASDLFLFPTGKTLVFNKHCHVYEATLPDYSEYVFGEKKVKNGKFTCRQEMINKKYPSLNNIMMDCHQRLHEEIRKKSQEKEN